MAAMESSAPVLQLHGEKEGTESGVEKLENGGKSAAAAAAWEGGMKDLRDVHPGIVHQEEESSSPATTAVGTQLSENAEEESVVKKSHGSDGTTQGVFTESGEEDQRTSDLKEMLDYYEQEVAKSLRLCEQQPVPPPEDDATSNPTTTTTTTENQSKERLGGRAADLQDLGSTSLDGAKEEEGSPRPGLIKSLVGTKIVPLVAPLVTPLVSVVTVVGESTAAILVGRGEDSASEKTAAANQAAGSEQKEFTAAAERAVVEPTTPSKEAPILGRVENLESQMDSLEEKQSPSRGSEQQQPSRLSVSSLGGSPPTPSSLEKRCRPAKDVLEETEVKGTLVERVQSLEQRLNQVVTPGETVGETVEGGGIPSVAVAVAQEEPAEEPAVQGATEQELEQGLGEEEEAAVPVTSPTPIVTEPDESTAPETEVPKEEDEGVPVETEALDETIIVPKATPEAHAQVGEQEGSVGATPQQQKQQTAEKGKKKSFQKLRAALRRLFKPKSAS
ncbi:unnamed protein product [Sphagnum tenellum]